MHRHIQPTQDNAMRVLHVDASPKRTNSSSKMLSAYFMQQLKQAIPDMAIDYLDIAAHTPPHISHAFIEAMYEPAASRNREMQQVLSYSDQLCACALMADALVFAMPMYNFCMPSSFKALIDHLVRPGLTFTTNADGTTTGNLSRQKLLFITTRGSDLRPSSPWAYMDALTPALKSAFSFMGADAPIFVDVQPLEIDDENAKTLILNDARKRLDAIAKDWAKNY
jgi:FMN-dependent NADH-azoreductase